MTEPSTSTNGDSLGTNATLSPMAKMINKMDGKKNSIGPSFPLEDSKSCPLSLPASGNGFGNKY